MSKNLTKLLRDKALLCKIEVEGGINLGEIHSDYSALWASISSYPSIQVTIKNKMKGLYDTYRNYKKSITEEVVKSNDVYWKGAQLLNMGMDIMETVGNELLNLSKGIEKKCQQQVLCLTKELSKSMSYLQKMKETLEYELHYWTNLGELVLTIHVPSKIKLDLLVPGRRFLHSAIFQQYCIVNGKLKPGNQMLVFLFNDLLLFTISKVGEPKRMSGGPHFRLPVTPRGLPKTKPKNKLIEFMYLDGITIYDKAFGSDLLIEFVSPGKRIFAGFEDAKVKQEWLKNLKTEIVLWKGKILDKSDKRKDMDKKDKKLGEGERKGERKE